MTMTNDKVLDGPDRMILHAERFLQIPLGSKLLAICPTLDLIAAVTSVGQLDICRLNGQRAAVVKRNNSDATILSFDWAPSGILQRNVLKLSSYTLAYRVQADSYDANGATE